MLNGILLSLVPWMQVSGSRALLLTVTPMNFIIAIGIGMGLHFIFLAWNAIMTRSLSLIFGDKTSVFGKKENTRAIIIVASQKTLPVMVAIVGQLGGALGQVGLLVIPCVFAHINQIIIDSYIGNLWLQEDKRVPYGKERLT
ncbi:probable sodium/metabolite cotransporter BASS4, chloroplastic isoform X2 [Cryptomeria japonica]|uniref:probable sodium/metabolite cotransporter BASS4, chloroplastic isoform X2 n=1 Tax=Cryptomeria japonica TaxID=3369 RepID=UPI0027DA2F31|nr:probable sodium/metabolite cotransporter BASS4, chloroplastic isoform X2 [Cryptomeria japonica]